jgi:hypothetical protein
VLAAQLSAALIDGGRSANSWKGWNDARQAIVERFLPAPTAHGIEDVTILPDRVPVSIVVATCDRPDDLRACLTSLSAQ